MRKPWKAIPDGVLAAGRHRGYSGVVRSVLCPRIAVPWCFGICRVRYSAIDDIIPNRTNASNLLAFNGGAMHTDLGPRCARWACNMGAADDEMLWRQLPCLSTFNTQLYTGNILHYRVGSAKGNTISSLDYDPAVDVPCGVRKWSCAPYMSEIL